MNQYEAFAQRYWKVYPEKRLFYCQFVHRKSHRTILAFKPGLCSTRPGTNRLSHGTRHYTASTYRTRFGGADGELHLFTSGLDVEVSGYLHAPGRFTREAKTPSAQWIGEGGLQKRHNLSLLHSLIVLEIPQLYSSSVDYAGYVKLQCVCDIYSESTRIESPAGNTYPPLIIL